MISTTDQQQAQRDTLEAKIARGAIAGFIATFPMTFVLEYFQQRLPFWQRYNLPPGQITQKLVEHKLLRRSVNTPQHRFLTFIMHFGYGASLGTVYEVLFTSKSKHLALGEILERGIIVGAVVWAGNYLGLLPGLNILPSATKTPARRNLLMFGGHLVWSSVLVMVSNVLHQSAWRD